MTYASSRRMKDDGKGKSQSWEAHFEASMHHGTDVEDGDGYSVFYSDAFGPTEAEARRNLYLGMNKIIERMKADRDTLLAEILEEQQNGQDNPRT